jgi:hypothetical protein
MTMDFPTVPIGIQPYSLLYNTVHDEMIKGLGAKLVGDVPATIYSHEGHEVEMQRPPIGTQPAGVINGRIFAAGHRMYFITVTRQAEGLSSDVVRAYLESFRLSEEL